MHDEDKDHKLVGILEKDAPGAYQRLLKLFGEGEIIRLNNAYAASAARGGNIEYFARTTGASYNPRPGRICHILMAECAEENILVFEAAILACAPSDESLGSTLSPAAAERINLVLKLDKARHLHMLLASENETSAIFEDIRQTAAGGAAFSENQRLITMLQSWVKQYERRKDR